LEQNPSAQEQFSEHGPNEVRDPLAVPGMKFSKKVFSNRSEVRIQLYLYHPDDSGHPNHAGIMQVDPD
jgi:hypothetical protein